MDCIFSGPRWSGIPVFFAAAAVLVLCLVPRGSGAERAHDRSRIPGPAQAGILNGHPHTPAGLVDLVDPAGLERIVRGLSGADTIRLDGVPVVLKTRYAYTEQKHEAARYLLEEIGALGYEAVVQRFVLRTARPDLTGIALANSGDTVWAGSTDGAVYRAFSAGGWDQFEKCGNTGNKVFDLYVDPAGRLWAACGLTGGNLGALFVSPNGGSTWSLRKSGMNIYNIMAVAFSGEHYGIACGSFGTMVRTADGGGYWSGIDPGTFNYLALNGVAANGPMRFWIAAAAGYLFETTNLGSTWIEHKLDTYYPLNAIAFADSLHGAVVGTGVAYYTTDGGKSWIGTSVVLPPGVQPDLGCVAMFDSLRVIAAGGAGLIFLSENGGADWTPVEAGCPGDDDIAGIAFADRDLFWTAGRDETRLIDIGPPDVQCTHYQFGDTIWGENLRFRIEGRDAPDHRIVMCAHYDATSGTPYVCTPGADDNATGVAGVIASAGALYGASLSRTVEFVLFDGEEPGLLGSRYFTGNLDAGAVYDAVINLDMLGYDFRRDWSIKVSGRADPGDSSLADTVMMAIDSLGLLLQPDYTTVPNLISDHFTFQDVGIPGILLIESERNELNPTYHSCRDIADSVMFDYFTECVKAALGSVAFLAGYDFYGDGDAVRPVALYQNYPNPFASNTVISFTAPGAQNVAIDVFDVLGRLIARLEPFRIAGADSGYVDWDGRNRGGRQVSSGVYFVRLRSGGHEAVRKAVLVR